MHIPDHAIVICYIGRLTVDKGVLELVRAFASLTDESINLWLLIVGPDEESLVTEIDAISNNVRHRLSYVGFSSEPECYMAASDIFCLPSHREGFGSSVIEAAACGLPTITTRIYGLADSVSDNVTGVTFAAGDHLELAACILRLAVDGALRAQMAISGRRRVEQYFSQIILQKALKTFYKRIF